MSDFSARTVSLPTGPRAEGRLPRLVRALNWSSSVSICAARLLGVLAWAGSDADRDAILAAGAAA